LKSPGPVRGFFYFAFAYAALRKFFSSGPYCVAVAGGVKAPQVDGEEEQVFIELSSLKEF
jgi:hypothetical protein